LLNPRGHAGAGQAEAGSLIASNPARPGPLFDLTDFKRDLSELTDRLGNAQDCL
jgi:hypothetical protein